MLLPQNKIEVIGMPRLTSFNISKLKSKNLNKKLFFILHYLGNCHILITQIILNQNIKFLIIKVI